MDENPYRSPQQDLQRSDADAQRDRWRMLLFGPSNVVYRLAPFVFLIAAVAIALVVHWLTKR